MKPLKKLIRSAVSGLLVAAVAGCSATTCSGNQDNEKQPQLGFGQPAQPMVGQQDALRQKHESRMKRALQGGKLSVSHIVVSYLGATKAPPGITRTREQASERIKEAYDKIIKGADFGDIAREYSDGPFKAAGGLIGPFPAAKTPIPILKKIMSVPMGQVSEPYETAFGFHIIRRNPVQPGQQGPMAGQPGESKATGEKIHVRHISILYKNPARKLMPISRSKEEAKRRIEEVASKLDKDGTNFSKLAFEYSDGPGQYQGGDIGRVGRGRVPKVLEDAAFALKSNEISGVIESKFGYHIIQRLP